MEGLGKDGKMHLSVIGAKENTFILIQGMFIVVEVREKNFINVTMLPALRLWMKPHYVKRI